MKLLELFAGSRSAGKVAEFFRPNAAYHKKNTTSSVVRFARDGLSV